MYLDMVFLIDIFCVLLQLLPDILSDQELSMYLSADTDGSNVNGPTGADDILSLFDQADWYLQSHTLGLTLTKAKDAPWDQTFAESTQQASTCCIGRASICDMALFDKRHYWNLDQLNKSLPSDSTSSQQL